ncbi:DUF1648 domain-containing protein [Lacticaseibacillus daqingensis]|uniref:DUF1648 domain-containing protein n=1 Tax=Lacticaseibacillus daqingensis TaxID=2486014 RepID=UPI000F7B7DE9|nr:DUF1648 domain-containing protein [Lacticaseibacillus daqingensis]
MTAKSARRTLAQTIPVILAPTLYGVAVYAQLPARIAVHWGLNNQPDGWLPRPGAVFGLPLLMVVFQLIVVLAPRDTAKAPRFERVTHWLMPVLTVVLYLVTIQIALGTAIDVWRVATLLIGAMFLAMGNYLPTVPADYGAHWPKRRTLSRRAARLEGHVMVAGGLAILISLLLGPLAAALVLAVTCAGLLVVPLLYR